MKSKVKKEDNHGYKTLDEYLDNVSGNRSIKCHECGAHINTFLKNMKEYGWKIVGKKGVKYFCSYSCMKKELNRIEDKKNRQKAATLLNKYNGVLSLEECQFMDDFKLAAEEENYEIFKVNIKTYEDFRNFVAKNYDNIQDWLGLSQEEK